jgi:glycosyltransferase involved in cell wall biosynthesis
MRQKLQELGIVAGSIRVIHNWADGEQIRPIPAAENPLREAWDLQGKFVVGYSGNLGRAHDFDTILDAAELLKHEAEIVFLIIGAGAQLDWVLQEKSRRGLANLITKPYQNRDKLAESLSASDVHLVSLKPELEGLIVPSKIYGIAAAGRPMIFLGSDTGEVARMLSAASMGFAHPLGESGRLAARIQGLEEHREIAQEMGIAARAAFDQEFSLERAVREWKEVLI